MKTENNMLYYVNIQFDGSNRLYSYISHDLSVKVGDEVLVPVYDNETRNGIVISAGLYSVDDAPYPIEKTKTVIRKMITDEQKELFQRLAFDLNAVKKQRLIDEANETISVSEEVNENNEQKPKETQSVDIIAGIFTTVIATPILTLIFGFIIAIILLFLGWEDDDDLWLPFVLAVPVAIGFCIYAIMNPAPVQSKKSVKYHPKGSNGNSFGGGWTPGCPEEKMFSSTDSAFDFDGDGHLNSIESDTKFGIFFGDDE